MWRFVLPALVWVVCFGNSQAQEGVGLSLHTVREGETLSSIAASIGTTSDVLQRINALPTDSLTTGQRLLVPLRHAATEHPEHHIAKQQMDGFGGVVSFTVRGDLHLTSRFIDRLRIPYIAPSLGGVESLIEQPALMSYYEKTPRERRELKMHDNLVRFAVGIEDQEDIILDLTQALETVM